MEQQISGVQRQELLATALMEDDTPVAAISIHTNMNVEGQPENFHRQALQSAESAAGSSAGGLCCSCVSNVFLIRDQFGPHICVCSRSSTVTIHSKGISRSSISAVSAKHSKGRYGGNSFRLEPGLCHQLSHPHVMTTYNKWTANQSTAKKAPFCFFFKELKKAGGSYPQVWICVGCHPAGDSALTLYEHVYMDQQFDNLESTFQVV